MSESLADSLIHWFARNGGLIDSESVGFRYGGEFGRGAFALRDIAEGQTLFTIPRDLLLSTRTCALRDQLGEKGWRELGKGWASLILCMMWERAKGPDGKWASYFGWYMARLLRGSYYSRVLFSRGLIFGGGVGVYLFPGGRYPSRVV